MVGPILFIIYINDLEAGLKSSLSKFADDNNVGGRALTSAECEIIQKDLGQIIQWSEKWPMTFSVDKCKFIPFGSRNSNRTYYMCGNPLQVVKQESDLGVTVSSDLKHANHCKKKKNITKPTLCSDVYHETSNIRRQK